MFDDLPQYRVNVLDGGTYALSLVPSSITVPSVLMNSKLRSVHVAVIFRAPCFAT